MALTILAIPETIRYGFGDFVELYVDGPGVAPFTYLWTSTPADPSIIDPTAQDTFASPSYTTTYRVRRVDHVGTIETAEVVVTVTDGPPPPPPPALELSPAAGALFNGQVGVAYHQGAPFAAANGTPPYAWAVLGALPAGLALVVDGAGATIEGVPTIAGPVAFQVQITDAAAAVVALNYSILVAAAEVPPPAPEVVPDVPAPPGRSASSGGSAWVTASGQVSRRDRLADVQRLAVGVYRVTFRAGAGRSPSEYTARVGALAPFARSISARPENGGWRVLAFDHAGAPADCNFALRFCRV